MPNDPCRRAGPLLALLLALALTLSACSVLSDTDRGRSDAEGVAAPADIVAGVRAALDGRAEAVRSGDRRAFLAGVVRRPAFRRAQAAYLANLLQLPIAEFRYTFSPASLVRDHGDYWVVVDLHLQLDGYDVVPVVTRDRFRFRAVPGRPGRLRLASTTDAEWERRNRVHPAPWEAGTIDVRSGAGVLGIFDPGSRDHAAALLASVERGIAEVSAAVPYDWSRSVVLYALSDPEFLRTLPSLPGGDPDPLDAVAFPVPAGPGDPTVASTRFALHPRMLGLRGPDRDRLIRHELAHVAIGTRDDAVPLWLSEGIAEYVSVQPMAPQERRVAAAGVALARQARLRLPTDRAFTGPDSAAYYALSWWACEYLARSFGPSVLFSLLDAVAEAGGGTEQLLRTQLGLTGRQLARRAAQLMLTTYVGV